MIRLTEVVVRGTPIFYNRQIVYKIFTFYENHHYDYKFITIHRLTFSSKSRNGLTESPTRNSLWLMECEPFESSDLNRSCRRKFFIFKNSISTIHGVRSRGGWGATAPPPDFGGKFVNRVRPPDFGGICSEIFNSIIKF